MSSSNPKRIYLKRNSRNDLDDEYSRNQAGFPELEYGSPPRGTQVLNFSKESATEKEKKTDVIDEAMRRHTFKEKISALEAKDKDQEAEIKRLEDLSNKLRRKNSIEKSKSKGPNLERELADEKAEISGLQRANWRLKDLLRDEEARAEKKTSEAKMLKAEMAEQGRHFQTLQGMMSTLNEATQSAIHEQKQLELESNKREAETNALTVAKRNLQRQLDEANRKLSVEVEKGKNLQAKSTAEIARTQVLREEKHKLGTELEDKKKLLDTLRRSFRALHAFANDEPLDS